MTIDSLRLILDLDRYRPSTSKAIGDFTLVANQTLLNQRIEFKGSFEFFAVFRLMSVQTGAFRCRLATDESHRYSHAATAGGTNDRVRNECLFGTASRPAVLPVPLLIPRTNGILLDIEDVSGAGNTLHLVFEGVELYPR